MSRIANIIRGLFGRKPVHQQKDSMAPRGNGEKSVQPMPETVLFSYSTITNSSPTLMVPPSNTLANTPSRGMMQSPTTL